MVSNRVRFMQCLECGNDPEKCNAGSEDEDKDGLCKKYKKVEGRENWKAMLEKEKNRK